MRMNDWAPSRKRGAQDAAIAFAKERARTAPSDELAVVGFADAARVACGLTEVRRLSQIIEAVNGLRGVGGSTNVTAGLEAVAKLLRNRRSSEVVLLSDGFHNWGGDPLTTAASLKQCGCTIHTVGIGGDPRAVDEELLKRIASTDADGRPLYRFIGDKDGLVRHFAALGGLTK